MRTVIVCCDAVPLKLLGPYGSEWVETPALDQLAAEGATFDNLWIADASAGGVSFDYWAHVQSLRAVRLSDRSIRRDSADWEFVEPADEGCEAVFARAAEIWDEHDDGVALWIEVALAESGWKLPAEWRDRHLEDAEEAPSDLELLAAGWADRVAYFDSVLGAFIQSIEAESPQEPTIAFTAERGQPLGEHDGSIADRHRERRQIPLIVRRPNGPRSLRRTALLTPSDAASILGELSTAGSSAGLARPQDDERWWIAGDSQITTRQWRFIERTEGEPLLFALPEDVHELNDLASRTPGVVENFQAALRERGG